MNDLINSQMAIKAAMQDVSDKRSHDFNAGATRAANRIKLLPTVEAEPVRHGQWIDVTDFDSPDYEFACSECYYRNFERVMDAGAWNYCPNCGAKVDEGKEE